MSTNAVSAKKTLEFQSKHFDVLLTNPFGREVDEFSREGWFIYFYQEAKGRRENRDEILEIMNQLFVCPEDIMHGATKYELQPPHKSLEDVDAGELRGILEELLNIGFEKVPLSTRPGAITDSSYDVAQAKIYYDVNEHVAAAWRGETRDWNTIKSHGGTLTQANFEKRAIDLNMRADWHPFQTPRNRQYLWYRRGQNDNCKYSVVSLGNHFRVAASFPKLEDRVSWPGMPHGVDQYNFSTIKSEGELDVGGRKYSSKYLAEVTLTCARGQVTQTMIVTRVYVALVFRQGWIVNTHLKQVKSKNKTELSELINVGRTPGFREIGSGDVPFKYYFGVIGILRVHHGSDDNDGYTVCPSRRLSFHKTRKDMLEIFADEDKAKTAYDKMIGLYREWRDCPPFINRWQGEGGFDDGPQLTYNHNGQKLPATIVKVKLSDGFNWHPRS
jgi:hypothetical protein